MEVEHMYYVHPLERGSINFAEARVQVAEATLEAWVEDRRFTYTDMLVKV